MSFPNMPTDQQISVLCHIASDRGANLPAAGDREASQCAEDARASR